MSPRAGGAWRLARPALVAALAAAAAAQAVTNECTYGWSGSNGPWEKCAAAGQVCVDPNWETRDNWICTCHPMFGHTGYGSADGAAATVAAAPGCSYPANGGCAADASACHNALTACIDDANRVAKCHVLPPFFNVQPDATPAPRTDWHIDECAASCTSCASSVAGTESNTCLAMENSIETLGCIDSNTRGVESDYQCLCTGYGVTQYSVTTAGGAQTQETGLSFPINDGGATRQCILPAAAAKTNACGSGTGRETCAAEAIKQACDDVFAVFDDPDAPRPDPLGDNGNCRCVAPYRGRGGTGACNELNECESRCPMCADTGGGNICWRAGQHCVDPAPLTGSVGDWYCLCAAEDPAVPSRPSTRTRSPQVCAKSGDCPDNACGEYQYCTDRDPGETGSWFCVCLPPYHGAAVESGPATCALDECIALCPTCNGVGKHGRSESHCGQYGQTCDDPDTSANSLMDWSCICESARAAVARVPAICPDPAAPPDVCDEAMTGGAYDGYKPRSVCAHWELACDSTGGTARCACVAPFDTDAFGDPTVNTVMAKCRLDECTLENVRTVCGPFPVDPNHFQECVDPQQVDSFNDWMCRCKCVGCLGEAVRAAATCTLDECLSTCSTCARQTLTAAHECWSEGQECDDPIAHPAVTGDWQCKCVGDSTGQPTSASAAVCTAPSAESGNECAFFEAFCKSGGQSCHDPDLVASGDWRCVCAVSTSMSAEAQLAECPHDECAVSPCGDTTTVHMDQTCTDTNPVQASLGDWYCECDLPGVGRNVGMPVVNCDEKHDACLREDDRGGQLCSQHGEQCVHPDANAADPDGWRCQCANDDSVFISGPDKGQISSTPLDCDGAREAGDECIGRTTCSDEGQYCVDESTASPNNWKCVCLAPYSTEGGAGETAKCVIDECTAVCSHCAKQTDDGVDLCTQHGQVCSDPDDDASVLRNWRCTCRDGATARADVPVMKAAVCEYDECSTATAQCPFPQTCVDQNTAVTALNTWWCVCPESAGLALGAPAVCEVNECSTEGSVCAEAGQLCEDDGLKGVDSGDWSCTCPLPATGTTAKGEATCTYPTGSPCIVNAAVCTARGQECEAAGSTFRCRCLFPTLGDPVVGGAASCTLPDEVDECTNPDDVCDGQVCHDPDLTVRYTWVCTCPNGGDEYLTRPVPSGVCVPEYDECTESCDTCVNGSGTNLCEQAGQMCEDGPGARDWECLCISNGSRARAAACLDECIANPNPCGMQTCTENVTTSTSTGDFACTCVNMSVSNTGGPAVCDECAIIPPVCGAEQSCEDAVKTDGELQDFTCTCANTVSRTGAPAVCLNECVAQPCGDGQICTDTNTSESATGDYICACVNVTGVTAIGKFATCDECEATLPPCATGQTCDDPATSDSSTGDFVCTCGNGVVGAPGQVAVCTFDECRQQPCLTMQSCDDPDHNTPDDFVCKCTQGGEAVGRPMTPCGDYLDECDVCHPLAPGQACPCPAPEQACNDPTKHMWSRYDWECKCQQTGYTQARGAVANCLVAPPPPPFVGPTPSDGARWFFEFRSRLDRSRYEEEGLKEAVVRVINLKGDGTVDEAVVGCEGCAAVTANNIVTHCWSFIGEGQVPCKPMAEYFGAAGNTSARGAAVLQTGAQSEGVFEFTGPEDAAKNAWVEALKQPPNNQEMVRSPHIEMEDGSFAAQQADGDDDDGGSSLLIIVIILLVLCCLIILGAVIYIRCQKQRENDARSQNHYDSEKRTSPTAAEMNPRGGGDSYGSKAASLPAQAPAPASEAPWPMRSESDMERMAQPDPYSHEAPRDFSQPAPINPLDTVFPTSPGNAINGIGGGSQNPSPRGVGGAMFPMAGAMGSPVGDQKETVVIGCGRNIEGQLGIGESMQAAVQFNPIEIHELTGLVIHRIECGSFHTVVVCAVDGRVLVSGEGRDGQLGLGNRLSPKYPTEVPFFRGKIPHCVACGEQHTLIATKSEDGVPGGNVYAFGAGEDGQLGLGTSDSYTIPTALPMFNGTGDRTDFIRCGTHHTMILHDGTLYGFGYNQYGQLGTGDTTVRMEPTPIDFFRGMHVRDVACGVVHTVVLCTDGLFVMGRNNHGQLGLGGATGPEAPVYPTPQRLAFFDGMLVKHISAWYHTMVATEDGLFAFGEADFGKLGTDPHAAYSDEYPAQDVPTPRSVEFFTGREIDQIIAGSYHSVVRCRGGQREGVYIWGNSDNGKLGHGHTEPVTNPAHSYLSSIQAYTAHSVAIGIDHTLIYATPRE